jgi:early secretory antigenic target protein ESAT-6
MAIVVQFNELTNASDTIATFVNDMNTTLEELETRLQSTLVDWDGDARLSYAGAKAQWDTAAANIATLLGMLSDSVITSNELMQASEIRNANRFGGPR